MEQKSLECTKNCTKDKIRPDAEEKDKLTQTTMMAQPDLSPTNTLPTESIETPPPLPNTGATTKRGRPANIEASQTEKDRAKHMCSKTSELFIQGEP